MPRPELEFQQPTADWVEVAAGINEQVLAEDLETGDRTALQRYDPGAMLPEVVSHVYAEEVYLLSGSLTDTHLEKTFLPGSYASRPPGMLHGPYCSEDGVLMLVTTRMPQ